MTLEELLNKLIEKGWKPRGLLNEVEYIKAFKDVQQGWRVEISYEDHGYYKSIREILSKESGLWQFVCENEMVFIPEGEIPYVERNYIFDYERYDVSEFQYWLMVGALLKEDEIEQFLLDNIKIDE